jgi:hypothetical protein
MMADSSTGGFLVPVTPIETAEAFEDVLHDFIAGLTGLPGDMVRPKWQGKSSGQPATGVDWCAFGIQEEGGDTIGGERHFGEGEGHNVASAHEPFSVLVSFYGRNSRAAARKLRLGLAVAQNREYLYRHELAFVEAGPNTHVPEIAGELWMDRWDIRLVFRRRVAAKYAILNIVKANVALKAENGFEVKSN